MTLRTHKIGGVSFLQYKNNTLHQHLADIIALQDKVSFLLKWRVKETIWDSLYKIKDITTTITTITNITYEKNY